MSRRAYCPNDGRFVRDTVATISGFGGEEHIADVRATCSRCGTVEPEIEGGWEWEDFYPETAPVGRPKRV